MPIRKTAGESVIVTPAIHTTIATMLVPSPIVR